MNRVRVPYIKTAILGNIDGYTSNPGAPLRGLEILDVGCGGGLLSEVCRMVLLTVAFIERMSNSFGVCGGVGWGGRLGTLFIPSLSFKDPLPEMACITLVIEKN